MEAVEEVVDMPKRGRIVGAPEFGRRAAPLDRAGAGIVAPGCDARKVERALERSLRFVTFADDTAQVGLGHDDPGKILQPFEFGGGQRCPLLAVDQAQRP